MCPVKIIIDLFADPVYPAFRDSLTTIRLKTIVFRRTFFILHMVIDLEFNRSYVLNIAFYAEYSFPVL